jgi:peptidoglycan L-alanyl-D-glutamate endopeptidase CwlK
MADQATLDKIRLLHPKLRAETEHIYLAQIVPALSGRAFCRFTFTLRTFEEQAALYAQGRTKLYDANGKKLGIVTKAKAGRSLHNYGVALDIVLIADGKMSYEDTVDFDKDGKVDWMEVINIFKNNGWEWGGDWKSFKDKPHVQKTFGHTWQQLYQKYQAKDFIPGTTYVNI